MEYIKLFNGQICGWKSIFFEKFVQGDFKEKIKKSLKKIIDHSILRKVYYDLKVLSLKII